MNLEQFELIPFPISLHQSGLLAPVSGPDDVTPPPGDAAVVLARGSRTRWIQTEIPGVNGENPDSPSIESRTVARMQAPFRSVPFTFTHSVEFTSSKGVGMDMNMTQAHVKASSSHRISSS